VWLASSAPRSRRTPTRPGGLPWWSWFRSGLVVARLRRSIRRPGGYSWLVTVPSLRQERLAADAVGVYQPVLLRAPNPWRGAAVVRVARVSRGARPEHRKRTASIRVTRSRLSTPPAPPSQEERAAGSYSHRHIAGARLGNGTYTIIVRGGIDGRPEIADTNSKSEQCPSEPARFVYRGNAVERRAALCASIPARV